MKNKKIAITILCFLVFSIGPVDSLIIPKERDNVVYAQMSESDQQTIKNDLRLSKQFNNTLTGIISSKQLSDDLNYLKNPPKDACGNYKIDEIKNAASRIKYSFITIADGASWIDGVKSYFQIKNESGGFDTIASSYENYMEPKLTNRTGFQFVILNNTGRKEVGDIILYKSRDKYYRFLYVSKINGTNYILRGMNDKIFIKPAGEVDALSMMRLRINNSDVSRENNCKITTEALILQINEFNYQRNTFFDLRETIIDVAQYVDDVRIGVITSLNTIVNLCTCVPVIGGAIGAVISEISFFASAILYDVNEKSLKPIIRLSNDLITYIDYERPDLDEFTQWWKNPVPVAENVNFTTTNIKNLTKDLHAKGSSLLNFELTTNPTSGKIILLESEGRHNGTFVYIPDKNYVGNVTFKYKVDDGIEESNELIVQIEVKPNDPPVAENMTIETYVNQPVTFSLNGIDIDDDNLSFIHDNPMYGSLSVNNNSSFNYVPKLEYIGNDSFSYWVNDGYLDSNKATVNINVFKDQVSLNMSYNKPTYYKLKLPNSFDLVLNSEEIQKNNLNFIFIPNFLIYDMDFQMIKNKFYFYPNLN